MNLTFYEAIARIPLGIAVTIEFAGPLAVAVAGSRRALDALWVVLAAAGILLLARGGGDVTTSGVLLALLAGVFWGCVHPAERSAPGVRSPAGRDWRSRWSWAAWPCCRWGSPAAARRCSIRRLLAAGAGVALLVLGDPVLARARGAAAAARRECSGS